MKQRSTGSSEDCRIGETPIFRWTEGATRKTTKSQGIKSNSSVSWILIAARHEKGAILRVSETKAKAAVAVLIETC